MNYTWKLYENYVWVVYELHAYTYIENYTDYVNHMKAASYK
jgi:hypothetical protein